MAEEIGGVDSQSLAESVAAAVAENLPEVPEGAEVPIEEGLLQPPVDDQVIEQPTPEEVQPVQVEPQEPVTPEMDELTLELARMGVDLGINRSDLPSEMQSVYDNFAQQALVRAQQWQATSNKLANQQAEINQFAQKLQNDPQKVLLTMAVTNPEAFRETVTAYERMGEDEFYRNTVIKDLQAEAKLAASERQEQLFRQQAVQQKVSQVTRATHIAADAYGVDRGMAEELVAAAITRGGGDIELANVATVVRRLAPAVKPTITPQEKAARTAVAPTASVQGQGAPATRTEDVGLGEPSPGLQHANRNPFLGLIRNAARSIVSSE